MPRASEIPRLAGEILVYKGIRWRRGCPIQKTYLGRENPGGIKGGPLGGKWVLETITKEAFEH